jgi:hypothetical protein
MISRLTLLSSVTLALLLALPAQAQIFTRCPDQLPAPVAAKRNAIIAAAKTKDLKALEKLIGPGEFVFFYGTDKDAIAYWKDSIRQGNDIPRIMAGVLAMPCVVTREENRVQYVWPSAAEFAWKDLTPAEQKALEVLYDGKVDDWYIEGRDKGYYVGWRLSIEANGAWSSFVAGD